MGIGEYFYHRHLMIRYGFLQKTWIWILLIQLIFENYFLESRDFKNINNEKKYLDTIFQYTNNPNDFENFGLKISSKEPFSINIRKGDDFYFVYKKDSILAFCGSGYDCGSNFEILKYSDTTCIKKSSDGSLCLEAKSKYIGVYTFPTKKTLLVFINLKMKPLFFFRTWMLIQLKNVKLQFLKKDMFP